MPAKKKAAKKKASKKKTSRKKSVSPRALATFRQVDCSKLTRIYEILNEGSSYPQAPLEGTGAGALYSLKIGPPTRPKR